MKARRIGRQILAALAYMHSKGVCHRDIKPDNVLFIDDFQTIKIVDFNVSKCFTDPANLRKMTTHTGTVAFSAPEQLSGVEYT